MVKAVKGKTIVLSESTRKACEAIKAAKDAKKAEAKKAEK